jgi:hypothetical protein
MVVSSVVMTTVVSMVVFHRIGFDRATVGFHFKTFLFGRMV